MWSPSPTPEALRVSDESSCTNGSNMRSRSAGGIVGPALETDTARSDGAAAPAGPPRRARGGGVLGGCAERVAHPRARPPGGQAPPGARVQVDREGEPLPPGHV